MAIRYVEGDATRPSESPAIIVHVCNDGGGWGRGFVLALSKRWKEPEAAYRKHEVHRLGDVELVEVEPSLWVANLIGQHGTRPIKGTPPVRYDAIRTGLGAVREHALRLRASIHMPRIGCGLAGGKWEEVEPLIVEELDAHGVSVTVYDLAT